MSPFDPEVSVPAEDRSAYVKDVAAHCMKYKGGEASKSVFQLVTTLALFAVNFGAMVYSLNVSYLLTLLLLIPASGLLIRVFIFQHDCGHGSFFKSKAANDWVGRFLGVLTVTPYDFWRRAHNLHHATSGNLDSRSIGGIDTVTMDEYAALPKGKQRLYRFYRHPVFLLLFGTPFYTLVMQRVPMNMASGFYEGYKTLTKDSIWKSIMMTNVAIVGFYGAMGLVFGWAAVFAIYLPILIVTSWIGGWLFYIQHQFEDTMWERQDDWDMQEAALMGSSYYELPKILQWFTGNIGLHHIHHLCSQIPNYKLQNCMDAKPELAEINKLTIRESLKCTGLKLWDEKGKRMVSLEEYWGL